MAEKGPDTWYPPRHYSTGTFRGQDRCYHCQGQTHYWQNTLQDVRSESEEQSDLGWAPNVWQKNIIPIIRRQIGQLSRICPSISFRARLQLINALVISRMTYMVSLWGNATPNHVRKAQVVLNSAARMATGSGRTTRQETLMSKCGWLKVEDMSSYYALTQMWKLIRWGTPAKLREHINIETDHRLSTQRPRLRQTAGSFRHRTSTNRNMMPSQLRSEVSVAKFKTGKTIVDTEKTTWRKTSRWWQTRGGWQTTRSGWQTTTWGKQTTWVKDSRHGLTHKLT